MVISMVIEFTVANQLFESKTHGSKIPDGAQVANKFYVKEVRLEGNIIIPGYRKFEIID